MKFSKAKPAADGAPQVDIAVPAFGYKSHISIDRRHGIIRRQQVTDASAHDRAQLRKGLIDPRNTAADVWADTAYRSAANERYLADLGKKSRIHRRKPRGRLMPNHQARANARKSAVRAHVEHPFANQRGPMRLVIRTIGVRKGQHHARQHRLQHDAMMLARTPNCACLMGSSAARRHPTPSAQR